MVGGWIRWVIALYWLAGMVPTAWGQAVGSIRGVVFDQDFDVPLSEARVTIAETNELATTTDQGNYTFATVAPGTYTLVFSKDGYTRQVRAGVLVAAGRLTELNASLTGDFTELEEFVVQEIDFGGQTETVLLELRMEAPALIDAISSNLISQSGASDAAGALNLVAGATVQDGKFAVVRGLPDRYVNSQINGVRLPTADAEKRAVELDQFPASVIDNIQVSKTFSPDQQGDASGGAVNLILKGIPEEAVFNLNLGTSYNTNVQDGDGFLSYEGGGVSPWGRSKGDRKRRADGTDWGGAVGVKQIDAPTDYKWGASGGSKYEFDDDFTLGGFASLSYESDSSHFDDGIDDQLWRTAPDQPLTPQYSQGAPGTDDFKTSLFDITRSTQEVKWSALGVLGFESENHKLTYTNLYTVAAEDEVTLAEDTRGKSYFYPGYDVDDPTHPGNVATQGAPWLRTETLAYTRRETRTSQLRGEHKLFDPDLALSESWRLLAPEFDWTVALSRAESDQPDKRQFGSLWIPPVVTEDFSFPAQHNQYKPAAAFTLGNLQRTFRYIEEESEQYQANIKFPYQNWTEREGYWKFGMFRDEVTRHFNQDSYSNFDDNDARYFGEWNDLWSAHWADEFHRIYPGEIDVDYRGDQLIEAYYWMFDIPVLPYFKVTGGVRQEDSELKVVVSPEKDATWIPPGETAQFVLNPGDADVNSPSNNSLPQLGFEYNPFSSVTVRANYAETLARQTFRELTPVQQSEYLGADIFVGNPFLRLSTLKNYDLRFDYTPYTGGLLSTSFFYKQIKDPIEYAQRPGPGYFYTTAVNYPEGELSGYELEFRQSMGHFFEVLEGLDLGANATFIDSQVTLPDDEQAELASRNVLAPAKTRDMTNAPEHLYNLYMNYALDRLGWQGGQFAVFYTVRGDTLVAGAGAGSGFYVPSIYEKEYGTLNLSLAQKVGDHLDFKFQAKNLLDPEIETVYRSEYIGPDVTKTRYTKGREYSFSMGVKF